MASHFETPCCAFALLNACAGFEQLRAPHNGYRVLLVQANRSLEPSEWISLGHTGGFIEGNPKPNVRKHRDDPDPIDASKL